MNFEEWKENVPEVIREDVLWTVRAYQLALFLSDIAWKDVAKLSGTPGMRSLSDQLYRSAGSICANIEEGYSKMSSRDKARFYEYSLGSARETRGWFYRARHMLDKKVAAHRMSLVTEIIKLLITMVPDQRKMTVNETVVAYKATAILDEEVPH